MKKLIIVIITASLAVIAFVLSYRMWSDYSQAKEAEAALTNMEANKPPRYIAEVPVKASASHSDSVVVSVDSQGQVKLNREDVGKINETEELRSKLTQLLNIRVDKTVTLKVPREMKYSAVTKLMDEIKKG